ncbi:MAG: phospho-N-acetylmuramoyl-pentapeptide-transferase [Nitrospirae bacterium]|nr:MAG: phospho-N-acetylmuramoyl-pentapeptide-transferase [Nitrospirota bacterium]
MRDHVSAFNVFRYITFRAMLSVLTALGISLVVGPWFIRTMRARSGGQPIRELGPESHLPKAGTPTMGGAMILVAVVLTALLWGRWSNPYFVVVLGVTLGFGLLGLADDYLKVVAHDPRGLAPRYKLGGQLVLAAGVGLFLYLHPVEGSSTLLTVPFFKQVHPDLGALYIPFAMIVIVGTSNAVNLTDGLDGLAIMPVIICATVFALIAYVTGHARLAAYLNLPYVPGVGEVSVFLGAVIGAGLGFLWFNAYPATVFMGDVGSLALGGALGTVAVLAKQELLLAVAGGVFVVEAVSVILQVASFKLFGRRVFRMAPLHHHFELKGWPEPKVIVRAWIVTIVLGFIALSTLKLR